MIMVSEKMGHKSEDDPLTLHSLYTCNTTQP
jgi:hypothetical protein